MQSFRKAASRNNNVHHFKQTKIPTLTNLGIWSAKVRSYKMPGMPRKDANLSTIQEKKQLSNQILKGKKYKHLATYSTC